MQVLQIFVSETCQKRWQKYLVSESQGSPNLLLIYSPKIHGEVQGLYLRTTVKRMAAIGRHFFIAFAFLIWLIERQMMNGIWTADLECQKQLFNQLRQP